jgi:hypothetical protein
LNRSHEFSSFFWLSKIRAKPTSIISFLFPPRCRFSSVRRCHAIVSCHASFSLIHDELAAYNSSYNNASSRCLPFQVKIEALNPHRRRRQPPSTAIKGYLNIGHSPHHSTTCLFCLLPSQSTRPSELHPPSLFRFTAAPTFIVPPHNDTHVMN